MLSRLFMCIVLCKMLLSGKCKYAFFQMLSYPHPRGAQNPRTMLTLASDSGSPPALEKLQASVLPVEPPQPRQPAAPATPATPSLIPSYTPRALSQPWWPCQAPLLSFFCLLTALWTHRPAFLWGI